MNNSSSKSKKETRTCDTHGIKYSVWLGESGELLSGHCPVCMEKEDIELDRKLRELHSNLKECQVEEAEYLRIANGSLYSNITPWMKALFGMILMVIPSILLLSGLLRQYVDLLGVLYLSMGILFIIYLNSQKIKARERLEQKQNEITQIKRTIEQTLENKTVEILSE